MPAFVLFCSPSGSAHVRDHVRALSLSLGVLHHSGLLTISSIHTGQLSHIRCLAQTHIRYFLQPNTADVCAGYPRMMIWPTFPRLSQKKSKHRTSVYGVIHLRLVVLKPGERALNVSGAFWTGKSILQCRDINKNKKEKKSQNNNNKRTSLPD